VVTAALELAERFGELGAYVQRMERTFLDEPQRLAFASQALSLRFPQGNYGGLHAEQVLEPRWQEDSEWSLWATYNVCQEAILQGGLSRRSPKGAWFGHVRFVPSEKTFASTRRCGTWRSC